jgi:aldehyde:ferredoxin oxidoreductase
MPTGPAKGGVPNLDYMLDEYYKFRGCDPKTGYPKKETLIRLDMGSVAKDLEARRMLAHA